MHSRRRKRRFRKGVCRTISAQASTTLRLTTGSATWISPTVMAGEDYRLKPEENFAQGNPRRL